MRVVTADEMTALDKETIEEYGIPGAALMERAGTAVAAAVRRLAAERGAAGAERVHILCCRGNNGGDGMVAARALANWGARVRVYLIGGRQGLRGEAALFLQALLRMGIPVHDVGEGEIKKLGLALGTADVIVDAMLGTGARGPLRPLVASAVLAANASGRPVVAVDVPTGVDASTGETGDVAIRAEVTVTFGLPKLGHLLDPGRAHTGRLVVAEIGFPRQLLEAAGAGRIWVRRETAQGLLRERPLAAHKGTFGRTVVVAGSVGMAGAAVLALRGALRSGTGLVMWAGPRDLLPTIQAAVPEATASPLPGPGDTFSREGAEHLLRLLRPGDALAVGPGMGRSEAAGAGLFTLLSQAGVPAVVDADALNAMAAWGRDERRRLGRREDRIYTPHAKEAARLLAWETQAVVGRRLDALARLVAEWGGTVLLKGNPTLIQEDGGRLAINSTGDSSLSRGGTGDVLTGLAAGLLAQGYGTWEAAVLAAYLHGRAGEIAGRRRSAYAVVASDVAEAIARAYRELCAPHRGDAEGAQAI